MLFYVFCGIFHSKFGGVITFAVEVWSWKLWKIKGFIGVTRRESPIELRRVIKTSQNADVRCFDGSTQFNWRFTPRNANESLDLP